MNGEINCDPERHVKHSTEGVKKRGERGREKTPISFTYILAGGNDLPLPTPIIGRIDR